MRFFTHSFLLQEVETGCACYLLNVDAIPDLIISSRSRLSFQELPDTNEIEVVTSVNGHTATVRLNASKIPSYLKTLVAEHSVFMEDTRTASFGIGLHSEKLASQPPVPARPAYRIIVVADNHLELVTDMTPEVRDVLFELGQ